MKNKSKYILILGISILFVFTIYKYNINTTYSSSDNVFNENAALNNKTIYLTFDDGPSYKVTNKVLDVLKENEVNATFFLIGNQIKGKEDVVKRIYNEGNGIGLHTYTHKINKIYSSDDAFMKEMIECRNEINRVIGISPNIIRFP
ncbi:MAG: polysaccharide deacetylase family protein, partial [Clostridium sp.]